MARMIDGKPENQAEAEVWESLKRFLPDSHVVYHNREIRGREFDFCVFLESIGILIIEVKGWSKEHITVEGPDSIRVEGYTDPQKSPKKQARAYRFALLNRIKREHNESPLVFDMVCYPNITKEDYLESRLDIVSEEISTIFREELADEERLLRKISMAYTAYLTVGHADFTPELMLRLRRDWEPDPQPIPETRAPASAAPEESFPGKRALRPYSVLCAFPANLPEGEAETLAETYFCGTKIILFAANAADYGRVLSVFESAFRTHNLQADRSGFSIGWKEPFARGEKDTKLFNLEVYLCADLGRLSPEPIRIEEGRADAEEESVLRRLAGRTSFNVEQYFVEHAPADRNTLVSAGAGTGKTYSMVSRVAFLCNRRENPVTDLSGEISMVTFTNDAAENMKSRIRRMFTNYFVLTADPRFLKFLEEVDRADISTIHSFVMNLLRKEVLYTGLGIDFRITKDEYLRRRKYTGHLGAFFTAKESEEPGFSDRIPVPVYKLRDKLMDLAEKLYQKNVDVRKIKASEMGTDVSGFIPYFNELIEKVVIPAEKDYLDDLHADNGILLNECIMLLDSVLDRMDGKVRSVRYRYLFIDEFQDTDDVQIRMFQRLQKAMETPCRIFVVGDLKQSIYRFRGATLSAFDRMRQDSLYPWEEYRLSVNYRTDRRLLDAFAPVFRYMGSENYLPYREDEDLLSGDTEMETPEENLFVMETCRGDDNKDGALETCFRILEKQKAILADAVRERASHGKAPLSAAERTVAILVRSNWQVERLMQYAREHNIVMRTKSGGDLFQIEPTFDLYKLVCALNNSSNPVCLVNFIESGYTDLKIDYQKYHGRSEEEIREDLIRILDEFFVARMGKLWRQVVCDSYAQPALFVLKEIYDALQPWRSCGDWKYYRTNYECLLEHLTRSADIGVLTMNGLEKYLRVAISTQQERPSRSADEEENGVRVLCTTVHKSKGLEYGVVILPYTNDTMYREQPKDVVADYTDQRLSYAVPFGQGNDTVLQFNSNYDSPTETTEGIREEARTLYVAMTRAIRTVVWIKDMKREDKLNWAQMLEVDDAG